MASSAGERADFNCSLQRAVLSLVPLRYKEMVDVGNCEVKQSLHHRTERRGGGGELMQISDFLSVSKVLSGSIYCACRCRVSV